MSLREVASHRWLVVLQGSADWGGGGGDEAVRFAVKSHRIFLQSPCCGFQFLLGGNFEVILLLRFKKCIASCSRPPVT